MVQHRFLEDSEHNLVNVLLVDDDQVDREIVVRAFLEYGLGNPIIQARDGVEALDLIRDGDITNRVRKPYIILLDLNMPRMNGIDFLREIRSDPVHKDDIVFVLTTSDSEKDRKDTSELNVANYFNKMITTNDMDKVIEVIREYCRVIDLSS